MFVSISHFRYLRVVSQTTSHWVKLHIELFTSLEGGSNIKVKEVPVVPFREFVFWYLLGC